MKHPPNFSTGDPSYFVVAAISGRESPILLTFSNAATLSDIGECEGTGSFTVDVREAIFFRYSGGHQHFS